MGRRADHGPDRRGRGPRRRQRRGDAIWNGATEVDRWLVLAGSNQWHLHPVGSADWDGLDTAIAVHTNRPTSRPSPSTIDGAQSAAHRQFR